jgi:hypothetical protein
MELDRVAADIVLRNIREAIPSRWAAKIEELRRIAQGRATIRLADYLAETGCDLEDVYAGAGSWSDLRLGAGLPVAKAGPQETVLRRACGRLLHVDDLLRIEAYQRFLMAQAPPALRSLPAREQRLLRMLVASMVDTAVTKSTSLEEGCALLWDHPQVREELLELLEVLASRIEHVPYGLESRPDVPLQVHARYSRIEILAAFGIGEGAQVAPWRSGVYPAKEAAADLLAFTLDKTSGKFSPTTRYRDYAINPELIHWQSQSTTRADSETGLRYQRHAELGTSVMLFARLRTDDRAFWFLGPATYVRHESELPMSVTWKLEYRLPGDLFASFRAAA